MPCSCHAVALTTRWLRLTARFLWSSLDWAKAFDSISPDSLLQALWRFGVPSEMIEMVRAIYSDRRFFVREGEETSLHHSQQFGIVQGCLLSPYLFSIVMTVLLTDASARCRAESENQSWGDYPHDILYADDTLVIDTDARRAQLYMDCIRAGGEEYGLSFNWKKLECLAVRHGGTVHKADGAAVTPKASMKYLGSLLTETGRIGTELNQRLGAATSVFNELERVWKHASITRHRKIEIFNACVVTKLTYGLESAWLNKLECRRLDAYQNRCLRKICKVGPSYYSRVSNEEVLRLSGQTPLSHRLLMQQLHLYGRIARLPNEDPVRKSVLNTGDIQPKTAQFRRRQGRPRKCWARQVFNFALKAAQGLPELRRQLCTAAPTTLWKDTVQRYTAELPLAWKPGDAEPNTAGIPMN